MARLSTGAMICFQRLLSDAKQPRQLLCKVLSSFFNISGNQPIFCFIHSLRNYTLHEFLPVLDLKINLIDFQLEIIINVEILRGSKRGLREPRNKKNKIQMESYLKAQSYLEELEKNGDSYSIETIANEYFVLIQNFYEWLTQRQLSIHQADFVRLQQIYKELDA